MSSAADERDPPGGDAIEVDPAVIVAACVAYTGAAVTVVAGAAYTGAAVTVVDGALEVGAGAA